MPDGSQSVRKGRKFDQVVDGARAVFMADGFDRASVDDIAKTAGVSKATLYSYFPDKRLLFMEVMKQECISQADHAIELIDDTAPVQTVLTLAGHAMLTIFLSDFGQQTFRMAVAESGNFPGLGQQFYECGPALIVETLVPYFEKAEARNELKIDDKTLAAHQFAELCKSDLFPRKVMHIQDSFTQEEQNRVVESAVQMFLARYGA